MSQGAATPGTGETRGTAGTGGTGGRRVSPTEIPDLVERFRAGNRRALSRLLTQVENGTDAGREALRALYGASGRAHVIGVTGPPGAGKSTLVNRLIGVWRARGRTVAVVAVDPSSSLTGGATLGDRVRMMETYADEGVFIRSMATRGHLGGLATSTVAAAAVLDAAGFPLIFVETVGTGQSEVEVAAIADTTVVVQAPEMGDEVQAIKAGLLQVADLGVGNKADRPGADRAASQLRSMLTVGAQHDRAFGDRPRPKRPEVILASATTGSGVPELLAALDRRHPGGPDATTDGATDEAAERSRLARAEAQLSGILLERAWRRLAEPDLVGRRDALLAEVATHAVDPYTAADHLLALLSPAERRIG